MPSCSKAPSMSPPNAPRCRRTIKLSAKAADNQAQRLRFTRADFLPAAPSRPYFRSTPTLASSPIPGSEILASKTVPLKHTTDTLPTPDSPSPAKKPCRLNDNDSNVVKPELLPALSQDVLAVNPTPWNCEALRTNNDHFPAAYQPPKSVFETEWSRMERAWYSSYAAHIGQGEGPLVFTPNEALARTIRMLKMHRTRLYSRRARALIGQEEVAQLATLVRELFEEGYKGLALLAFPLCDEYPEDEEDSEVAARLKLEAAV